MANLMTLTFAHALNCIEFVPISLLAFVTILNVWMIWRSAILHINLKAILLVQSFLIFGYSCGRIFELIWLFTQNFQSNPSEFFFFINFMHATIAEANMIGHVMIVERIMAILFVRKYEEWKSPWFALGWMSIMILFAILTFVIPSFGASNKLGFAVIFTHVVLIFSIVELIAFAILNLYNRKRYEYFNNIRADLTHKYKLSERYQLNQNIYSGQQLGPSFFFHLVNIICSNVVCIMIVYLQLQSPLFDLYMAIIFVVHALSKLGIEITVITFHPVMRRKMLEIWKHFLRILNCRNASTVQQVNIIDRGPARELVALGQLRGTRTNCGRGKIEQKDQQNQQMKHFKILEHFWQ